ncbi:acyl transferase 4-like [Triticum urartu]|uniref:3'-N-debenzoyl-2'-deoxytaxol N-benzoyltransferase n=1 Tax=Triticum urartu TaxID=4572 RepID=A0A8R7R5K6_TRIUA|nr:acyl transferase 4-like [Triticum urartu]
MTGTKTVAKSPPELIVPALTTPGGTLPLSSIDKAAGSAGLVNLIQVFAPPSFTAARMSQGAAAAMAAMRDGLARALVPYYPVAGRVAPSGLAVDCTGEGVWFVEAAASCALADVDGLGCCPLLIPGELLLPRPPPGEKLDGLILMVQATRFTCGGFAVGISFSHAVFDGQGAAQFLTAVGELARGLQAPSVIPVWDHDAIPDPPSPPPPQLTEFRLVTQVADISAESIARVKDDFKQAAATSTGEVCSTFDALTAVVFKCRALALASALPDDADVRIAFAAGTRHLLRGVLPAVDGYYGNCVYLACVTRAGKAVREASLAEVVGAVREAKEAVPARFAGWMRGVDHYDVPLDYSTVTVSDWSRVGFDEVDYGFGAPGYVFPLNDHVNFVASLNYVRPPAPRRGGIRVVLRCVEEPHAAAFAVELAKFA